MELVALLRLVVTRARRSNDFWDAVSEPCGLPGWFGRNLDAWS
ncbi:barstar family protein, partial [Streptomyces sp. NPDC047028]